MTHFDADRVLAQLERSSHGLGEPRRATLVLGAADTAWHPASTKHDITGPASVTYTQYADGGVEASVGEPPRITVNRNTAADRLARTQGGRIPQHRA